MSRRSRTTLVLSVRIPVPAGKTQKELIEAVTACLRTQGVPMPPSLASAETLVQVEKREVVYL